MDRDHTLDHELMNEAVAEAEAHWRYLHSVPESAFTEYRTTEYIKNIADRYPVKTVELGMDTGLVCWLDAGADKTVALRADIDALLTESGPLHRCGHDAHASTLLGAMHYLSKASGKNDEGGSAINKEHTLPYNVLFIFQPAEEGTHGARALLEHGLLETVPQRPVRIFGIHNRPEVRCGDIVVHRGPLMSEKSVFEIKYTGRTGHGSLPHKCIDPVVASCSFVCSLQSVVSRNTDPFQPVICTVNSVTAGRPDQSVPESAVITGYIRSLDHDTHERMRERVSRLAESTAEAYECGCECVLKRMVPAVFNSDAMYETAEKAAVMAAGREHVVDAQPVLASEDFAVYGAEIPSFFYWVGSGTEGRVNAPWHDPAFRMDEEYMKTAVPLLCAAALTD